MELPNKVIKALSSKKWYHATTLEGYNSIKERGVIVDYNCGTPLDFGYGFYLTTTAEFAESYISRVFKWNKGFDDSLVIMEYEANPLDWFQGSEYRTKIFPAFDDDFAEFVFYNRTENIYGENQHSYDSIYGVMSDSSPITLIALYNAGEITKENVIDGLKKNNRMKQISLHSQELCDIIKLMGAYVYDPETGDRKELEKHDYD